MGFPQALEQAAAHAHPQVHLQQPQGQGIAVVDRQCSKAEHQHGLLGLHRDAAPGLVWLGQQRGECMGWLLPALEAPMDLGLQSAVGGAMNHHHRIAAGQLLCPLLQHRRLQVLQLVEATQRVMAVAATAVEQLAQPLMGQVERVLLQPLQGLQVQITLQLNLTVIQQRVLHHLQQERQEAGGIAANAFERQHQPVIIGF